MKIRNLVLRIASVAVLAAAVGAQAVGVGPVDLGSAAGFTVFAVSGDLDGKFSTSNSQTTVFGDIALGPEGEQNFSEATIHGTFFVDPTADNTKSNNVTFDGGTVVRDLSQEVADIFSAATVAAGLTPTQTFGEIDDSLLIASAGGVNVIQAGKIKLDGSEILTLSGALGDVFIINATDLNLTGTAQVALQGGLTSADVLFNLSNEYVQNGDSVANGIVLCVASNGCDKGARNNGAFLNGALFADSVTLTSGAQIVGNPPIPEPGAALLFALGVLGVRARSLRA